MNDGLIIKIQPEIAVLMRDGKRSERVPAPEGFLFRSHSQRVPDNATTEELFRFVNSHMYEVSYY